MACDGVGDTNDDGLVGGREQNRVSRHPYEQWTHQESKELLKLLTEEVNNAGCSKKEKITAIVLPKLNARLGSCKEYNHVKNKIKNWRIRLEPTKEFDAYGAHWDPIRQEFIATDDAWEKLKKDHPKAASLRQKIFEDYEQIKLVIEHYHPLGNNGRNATILKPCSAEKKKDNVVIEAATPISTPSPLMNDSPLSISQGPTSAPSTGSTSIQRKRKAQMVETPIGPHANMEKAAKNDMNCQLPNINDKLFNAVDRAMEELKWRAYEVFATPTSKEAFLRMHNDERVRFLLYKLQHAAYEEFKGMK